ncbi:MULTISPECIES: hypothetical protein [Catenuloplanes]|uniref:Uncharacterized protein n=1 Tax=Catenuloplanes niger TaxID=587534 RepID=A0AAE4CT50_9ACTN|nr:hypothetical protein [Catenuloplanes niger]MDR7321943.1 hypothetical protein [Catenuloplanes niger]
MISALIFLVAVLTFAGPFVVLDTDESSWGQRHTTITATGFDLILGNPPTIVTEGDSRSGDSSVPGLAEAAESVPNSPAGLADGSSARVWATAAFMLTLGAAALAAFRNGRGLGALAALIALMAAGAVSGSAMSIVTKVEDSRAMSEIFPSAGIGDGAGWAYVLLGFGAFFVFLDAMVTHARPKVFVPRNLMAAGYPPPGYPQQQPFPQQGFPPPPGYPQQGFPPPQQPYPMPPQAMPPHAMPPQAMPPQAMPPQAMPPQAMPPQPYPPRGMPPQPYPPQQYPPSQPPYGAPYGQ